MSHQAISFVKSAIRILGYVMLLAASLDYTNLEWVGAWTTTAAIILVVSEVVGICEEIGY